MICFSCATTWPRTVIVGIQPEVAFAMVQLGLELGNVATALDLEERLALLRHEAK